MADDPGLIGSQNAENYDGGYTIYSDDPAKQALINPNRTRQKSTPTGAIKSQQTGSPSAATAKPTAAQRQDYREFQQYQQYQQFKQMPKDSAEYQRFRDWQEWKQYQQWRNRDSENP